ncbi:MAG: (Fe-S)-binding protein [Desulfobacter sp.]|nr:MAG: (Fe-S)-binding protein [Desulfobacter sp.]
MAGQTYFNPGCALSIYKPEMENKIIGFLNRYYRETTIHKICCRHDPQLEQGALIINLCAGCDQRFGSLYDGISTISLWEIMDRLDSFLYPDYKGLKVSVHDACPVRENPKVHRAVRNCLEKMNIEVIETKFNRTRSVCCGDDFYPKLSLEKIHNLMKKRADSMPCENVCVYCVSCIKSMHIGGKRPRYLVDLLMTEPSDPQVYDTVKWHEQLQEYIDNH